MASVNRTGLLDESVTGNLSGSPEVLEIQQVRHVAVITVTNSVGTTIDADVEHSADGTNWESVASFTTIIANTYESVQVTVNLLPKVRATMSGATITSADIKIDLFNDKAR